MLLLVLEVAIIILTAKATGISEVKIGYTPAKKEEGKIIERVIKIQQEGVNDNQEYFNIEPTEEPIINLNQMEIETLYMITYAEAGLEDEEHQVAVAATILNRMMAESFPNDFYEVIYQKNAFSSVHNEKIYIMTDEPYEVTLDMIPESTKNAVHRALMGEDPTEEALRAEARRLGIDEEQYAEGGALFFYNPNACGTNALEEREGIKVKVSLGLHTFYKVWD